jgi:phosphate starvation-inducible protein PhoH
MTFRAAYLALTPTGHPPLQRHFSVIPLSGTAMPGGYKFDTDTMDAKIREFEDMKQRIDLLGRKLQAADEALVRSARGGTRRRGEDLDRLEGLRAQRSVESIRAESLANDTYVAHDENTAATFGTGANSGQPPAGTGDLFTKGSHQ